MTHDSTNFKVTDMTQRTRLPFRRTGLGLSLSLIFWAGSAPVAMAVKDYYQPDMEPEIISKSTHASGLPSISDNGRYVAYIANIVKYDGEQQRDQIFLWDDHVKKHVLISQDNQNSSGKQAEGNSLYPSLSGDGSRVAYISDSRDIDPVCDDGHMSVYLRMVGQTKTSKCLSRPSTGTKANGGSPYAPSLSGDGKKVGWTSEASNLVSNDNNGKVDVFLWSNTDSTIRLVSLDSEGNQANGHSDWLRLDKSGQRAVFMSAASNLVANDSNGVIDVFLRDIARGKTARVSVSSSGEQGNGLSAGPSISRDGKHVVFASAASNLVDNDSNGQFDIFVHHLDSAMTERVSIAVDGGEANGASDFAGITGDGRCVVFQSRATNLVADDTNGKEDAFVHDLLTHSTVRINQGKTGQEANGDSTFPVISADGTTVAFGFNASHLTNGSTQKGGEPAVYIEKLPAGMCH